MKINKKKLSTPERNDPTSLHATRCSHSASHLSGCVISVAHNGRTLGSNAYMRAPPTSLSINFFSLLHCMHATPLVLIPIPLPYSLLHFFLISCPFLSTLITYFILSFLYYSYMHIETDYSYSIRSI
jgi:hypothetical protein